MHAFIHAPVIIFVLSLNNHVLLKMQITTSKSMQNEKEIKTDEHKPIGNYICFCTVTYQFEMRQK